MSQTITVKLPDKTIQHYRRGARAARKSLAKFLAERLRETAPPATDELPSPLREELEALERLEDDALWQVARGQLLAARQRRYSQLLQKNNQAQLTMREQVQLRTLGAEARRLTLKKAHAYMLLKWRAFCD